ncbi:MAG TPA: DUF6448 family protein [Thermoanaerobaculia bacterium]|nr:DUF6448 family protein [Thermoanaerobaculia bacterium]
MILNAARSAALVAALAVLFPGRAAAHCDSVDGPVVTDARAALEKGDVTPVLKWVAPEGEKEIRAAFGRAVAVRKLGPDARELADTSFYETLVRVHRAGEGAPYTGLKPAGSVEPAIAKADAALAAGSADDFARLIAAHAADGLKTRFARVVEAKKHAGESVAKGREYVAAYVDYVHWVEGVVTAVHRGPAAHEGHAAAAAHVH